MTPEVRGSVIEQTAFSSKKEASSFPEVVNRHDYLEAIKRPDINGKITPQTPWLYFSMEIRALGFEFTGGLGVLAGDIICLADKAEVPIVGVTLDYPQKWNQRLHNFRQVEDFSDVAFDPEAEFVGKVNLRANSDLIPIDVYRKKIGENATIIKLGEKGLGELYNGDTSSEHRLYQQTVLCIGGMEALDMLGYNPAFIHLNESAMAFSAVSYLDRLCKEGVPFEDAKKRQAEKTMLTNHTLVPAAVASFSEGLFERYLLENIKDEKVKGLVRELISKTSDRCLNLSELAIEFSGRQNGVSREHSQIASESFKKSSGEAVCFEPVTNGINLAFWAPDFYAFYEKRGIIDKFQLPAKDYREKIDELGYKEQSEVKKMAKQDLLKFLETRLDQYGNPVHIPEDAKIATWARRFAGYKRPEMLFSNPDRLANILEEENMHLILAGKTHPRDEAMKDKMQEILTLVHNNPRLCQRVHFVQDYDEAAGVHLTTGSDIWINTPIRGKEACGTSWMKAIANNTLLISTEDGGVADVSGGHYFKIEGERESDEIESLYSNLKLAGQTIDSQKAWDYKVKDGLKAYLPIISGGRMIADYLNFQYPLVNN